MASPRYATYENRMGTNYNSMEELEPSNLRFSPIGSRSYYQEYPIPRGKGNDNISQTSRP